MTIREEDRLTEDETKQMRAAAKELLRLHGHKMDHSDRKILKKLACWFGCGSKKQTNFITNMDNSFKEENHEEKSQEKPESET